MIIVGRCCYIIFCVLSQITSNHRTGIDYDATGDGLQNGGALVVKGGKLIKYFAQLGPAHRMPNLELLEVILQ